jgi:hypothetical protein
MRLNLWKIAVSLHKKLKTGFNILEFLLQNKELQKTNIAEINLRLTYFLTQQV